VAERAGGTRGPIGVVGLGLMGTAIGERLLDAGFAVRVWNRTRERAGPLLDRGATWTDDPLGECPRVVVSLYDGAAVTAVIGAWLPHAPPGRIVIDTSTVAPETTRTLAAATASRGGVWLDAPISGSSAQTRTGTATVIVGGDDAAWAACADVWDALGGRVHHVGPSGSAAAMKLVTNLVLGLNRAALAEGLAFARSLGIDPARALAVLRDSPAASRQMDTKGEKMVGGDFTVQARLAQHDKDVALILAAAAGAGLDLPLTTAHRALLARALGLGLGALDNSAIIAAYGAPPPRGAEGPP
jgi:3-hydroxyisobutyrate dehydrogenase-like beta-hydroxyacid dehydrogenase